MLPLPGEAILLGDWLKFCLIMSVVALSSRGGAVARELLCELVESDGYMAGLELRPCMFMYVGLYTTRNNSYYPYDTC